MVALKRLSKYRLALGALIAFALFNTVLLGFELANYHPGTPINTNSSKYLFNPNPGNSALALLQGGSYVLAPVSWGFVLGAWLWRGRVRSQWTRLGLTEDLFRLLTKMRGSGTRTSIMEELETPKDRSQLSKSLGLDWTTIDYQVRVLLKYGLVIEESAYGNVKLYKLTPIGEVLLKALKEMERKEGTLRLDQASDTLYRP
jgi:DNA-binding transcriptional ArsR family regulator